MGDAYTTLADDESTLFYNPALLGHHDGLSVYALNVGVGAPDVWKDSDKFDNVSDDPVEIAGDFMNYPVHVHLSSVPGLKLENFGISFLYNLELNVLLYNQVHPFMEIDYRYDRGFVAGYAHSLGSGKAGQLSIGGSVKYISREGLYNRYSLLGTEILDAISSDDNENLKDIATSLGLGKDSAWGVDLGLDYRSEFSGGKYAAGIVVQDVADTRFRDESNPDAQIPDQDMAVSLGSSYTFSFGSLLDLTFSADLQQINKGLPFERLVHFGTMIDLPVIDIMAGYNKGGFSYGLELDVFFMKLFAGVYRSDIGPKEKSVKSKRMLVYLSLMDFSFDGLY